MVGESSGMALDDARIFVVGADGVARWVIAADGAMVIPVA